MLLSRLLYDSFLILSTLRCSKATFIWSRKPETPLPQIDFRLSNWIHFIVKKFSRLQFIWQSQSCLVGERGRGAWGRGGWRRQDEATWDVTCDQAVFLPFFLPHSLQTIPDPRVLEVGLTIVSPEGATISPLNILFTLPRLPRTTDGQLCAPYRKVHGLKKGFSIRWVHFRYLMTTTSDRMNNRIKFP